MKYHNNAIKAAHENSNFNRTLISVNGELKKLKDMVETDFAAMDVMQLQRTASWAMNAVKTQTDRIKYFYQQEGVSAAEYDKATAIQAKGEPQQKGTGDAWKDWMWAERTLRVHGQYAEQIKIEKEQLQGYQTTLENTTAALKTYHAMKVTIVNDNGTGGTGGKGNPNISETLRGQLKYVDDLAKVMGELGLEYDINKEKAEAYLSEVQRLVKEGIDPQSRAIIELIGRLQDLATLQRALDRVEPLSMVPTAHLNTSINMGDYSAFRKNIDNQLAKIDELDKAISTKIGKRGKDAYDANTKSVNALSSAMNQLFSGEFIMGSEAWMANLLYILNLTEEYNKKLAEAVAVQERTLKIQDQIRFKYNLLANTMVDLGTLMGQALGGMELAWQDFAAILIRVVQQIINSLIALEIESIVAAAASGTSKEVEKSGFYGLITAAVGIAALLALIESTKSSAQSAAMAHGGIVPAGYPNDSYPARLTSGEVVIPPGKLDSITGMRNINITVDGKIKGKDLALALRRANSMN
jgi:hypothetical protein